MLGRRWRKGGGMQRAGIQQRDVRSIGYRFARLEDVVQQGARREPGGAPEDPLDIEELRARDGAST